MKLNSFSKLSWAFITGSLLILLTACADEEEDGEVINGNIQLSGVLAGSTAPGQKVSARNISDGLCEANLSTCTPVNLEGRVFSGGAMLGDLGPDAFNITMIGASEDVILDPSHGLGGEIQFSLVDKTRFSSLYAAPSADNMPSNPVITRMEFYFDYLDATVTLSGTADAQNMDDTFVIRTVFAETATATDVSSTMIQGDKLIRASAETAFKWCNNTTCSETRDDVASGIIQDVSLVNHEFPGQGNPNYITFSVPVTNDFSVTHTQLVTPDSWWDVTFDMTNAILFSSTPSVVDSRSTLLNIFSLDYDPDQESETQETISVELIFSNTAPE